jgi:alanine-glyoxylate transaminase / serine-glyoxylate transaminase / serine-pyruvate transaminase
LSDDQTSVPRIDPAHLPPLPQLMIAGPGELHDDDLTVLGTQVLAHYGDVWVTLHTQVLEQLGKMLGSADLPYLIPGTGTTCLDAAVFNLFEAGQKVVIPATGFFGTRLAEVARAHRLEVIDVPVEIGAPIDPARVADVVGGADGVLTVHVETATGVRHPIEEIARVARDAGALYVVDCIASAGGELLDLDGMGLDALVTGSQKGLETPPGLGILALGPRGCERLDSRGEILGSWYLNLKTWDWYRKEWGAWHPHPVTMPTNLVLVLAASLNRIMEFGLQAWVARRAELAKRCREGLRDLGLEPIPDAGVEANLIVAAWADDPVAIQKHVLAQTGIMISGGLTPTAGKAIRVGLMGRTATEEMVDRLLEGIGKALAATPTAGS